MKKSREFQPRKRFGQNFLEDSGTIDRIVKAINPKPGQHIVEIGPGLGALTEPLIASGAKVTAIELDRNLVPVLRTKFFSADRFNVIEADALTFDFGALYNQSTPQENAVVKDKLRMVGNLPYNISTPLLFHLFKSVDFVADMHFMLQKEVVDRLAASPGSGKYGRLSIMAQYRCAVTSVLTVRPEAFRPPPKVWSAVAKLTPYATLPYICQDESILKRLVSQAFSMRRKTLRNALRKEMTAEDIEALAIDPQARPETLALSDFVRLADYVATRPADHESRSS